MNNFTSTCSQLVNSGTCSGVLNSTTYINSLCLIKVNKKYISFIT